MSNVKSSKSRKCKICLDWEDNKVTFDTPPGYPADLNKKTVKTRKLSFVDMKKAAIQCYDNLVQKKWTIDEAKKYLKVEGFNGRLIDEVIGASNNESINIMEVLPPVWFSHFELSSHIDTIMHLVVLGITQTVGIIIKTFLTKLRSYTQFHNFNHQMVNIRELNLDWCKTWAFGSQKTPYGPWVSENTLAFVRIFKCTYGVMELLVDIDKEKNELDSAMFLVCSWYAVFARIFQRSITESDILDTERHIKIFLSALHDVEKCYTDEECIKKFKMETTSNLCGLRNLVEFMRAYGPLRLYWEGGYKGEGILRYVKPMITQGTYTSSFSENAVRRYYKDRFFQSILNFDIKNNPDGDRTEGVRYTKFKTYPSMEYVDRSMNNGSYGGAVSLIILKNGQLCISCKEKKKHIPIVVETDDNNGYLYFESWVTSITFGATLKYTRLELLDSSIIMSYGLALPIPVESEKYVLCSNG
jgi:hypothetical protein